MSSILTRFSNILASSFEQYTYLTVGSGDDVVTRDRPDVTTKRPQNVRWRRTK